MSRTNYIVLIVVVVVAVGAYLYISALNNANNSDNKSGQVVINDTDGGLEVIALKDVAGGKAGGEASRLFRDDEYTLAVRAEDLPNSEVRYEGWLYELGAETPLYVGPLNRIAEGEYKGSWVLGYKAGRDLRSYDLLAITQEERDDQKPEKRVLEGVFR